MKILVYKKNDLKFYLNKENGLVSEKEQARRYKETETEKEIIKAHIAAVERIAGIRLEEEEE